MSNESLEWIKELRKPFEDNDISWLPKPTKAQTDAIKRDFKCGIRCQTCGAWHHPQVVHLPYVGHAAVTNRLLNVDPLWNWEFLCTNDDGSPVIDSNGGMWIALTINGVTRKGYGDAPSNKGADAMKERIGDAIRNAAMRFGVALELWHKGTLSDATLASETPSDDDHREPEKEPISDERLETAIEKIVNNEYSLDALYSRFDLNDDQIIKISKVFK